ncbi:MAG: type II toxin-antitoxin system PemK/MazF family toxin [Chloroflexota bacterium]
MNSWRPRAALVTAAATADPGTVIVAPMTTHGRAYPSRVPVTFQGTDGHVVIDQIRTVDKTRVARRLGMLDN